MRIPAMEATVEGMKRFKGNVEGVDYDSTKFYIKTDLDDSKGNAKGSATTEYSMGKSDEYDKYSHLSFPFTAVVEMEVVTSGKATKITLVTLKPKQAVAVKAA
jgi:hypothetical protein